MSFIFKGLGRRREQNDESAAPPDMGARRITDGFFDRHPRFLTTSRTSAHPWRLNLRYEAIFAEHRDVFAGARVLDIASHDGRWSLAALETGAASVTGVEARADLVRAAEENLREAGVEEDRFRFVGGDVFDVLGRDGIEADVVMCLGFLYHTLRYNELWTRIAARRPRHVLVDTLIRPGTPDAVVKLFRESTSRQGNAVGDEFSSGDQVLVGRPSLPALRLMGEAYGFTLVTLSDWATLLRDNPDADGIGDYRAGRRVTALFAAAQNA